MKHSATEETLMTMVVLILLQLILLDMMLISFCSYVLSTQTETSKKQESNFP